MTLYNINSPSSNFYLPSSFKEEAPKFDLSGATIGNLADTVQGNQIAHQKINISGEQKSLAEAAKEIQELLAQFQTNYPTNSDYEKQVFVNKIKEEVKTNSRVKEVLTAGGIELIKFICQPLGIPIEMGKKWLETAKRDR